MAYLGARSVEQVGDDVSKWRAIVARTRVCLAEVAARVRQIPVGQRETNAQVLRGARRQAGKPAKLPAGKLAKATNVAGATFVFGPRRRP
jgi:hypothetical protein